jgi:hypothetical protein
VSEGANSITICAQTISLTSSGLRLSATLNRLIRPTISVLLWL